LSGRADHGVPLAKEAVRAEEARVGDEIDLAVRLVDGVAGLRGDGACGKHERKDEQGGGTAEMQHEAILGGRRRQHWQFPAHVRVEAQVQY
jgi:hypothetical protein